MAKKTPKEFVKAFYPFAVQTQNKTGIDARFTLAQAALESGWGGSAPGNMFFGVKASKNTPDDQKQLIRTREVLSSPNVHFPEIISVTPRKDGKYDYVVRDWFRKYDSPEESFTDHAQFFFDNKRYRTALEYRQDPYRFAEEIAKAGYATDPNYANVLKSIVRTIEKNMQ